MLITFFVARVELSHTEYEDAQHFEQLADRMEAEVIRRVIVYRYGMMGTRSVFAASNYVDHEGFHTIIASREMGSEFSGSLGMGYVERIPDGEDAFAAFVQRERDAGVQGFTVRQPPARALRPIRVSTVGSL